MDAGSVLARAERSLAAVDTLGRREDAATLDAGGEQLVVVPLGDLRTARLDPVAYAIRPILPRGLVTLLGGHGGAGKSILALTLGAHFASAAPFGGLETGFGRAAIVTLEDAAPIVRWRLRQVAEAYQLDMDALARNVTVIDGTSGDGSLVEEKNEFGVRKLVQAPSMALLGSLVEGCSLVIIDNASDAFDGDENHRRQVRAFIRMLGGIARENDAAVLLLAHIDKNTVKHGGSQNYSGSTAWHNSVRSRLALAEVEGGVELRHEKLNVGKKLVQPLLFAWNDHGVLVQAHRPEASAKRTDQAPDTSAEDQAAVFAAIGSATAASVNVPTARSGPATALQALQTIPELPKALRCKAGRERFWNALTALQRSGAILAEEYRTPARHVRERWIAAPVAHALQSPRTPLPVEPAQLAQRRSTADCAGSPSTGATGATGAADGVGRTSSDVAEHPSQAPVKPAG